MIKDVRYELTQHGLSLNMEKCLVQTNSATAHIAPINVEGQSIPMVTATEGFKVLGTQFTLLGKCSAELRHRISAAWGKFHSLWPLLGKRDGNLEKRLRLFDSSVTQTALWCCESWLLTQGEKRLLQTTQNAMLRRIAGSRRKPDENWVDWIKRSTRQAVRTAKEYHIRLWRDAHLQSKWTWAGHIWRMDSNRLAHRAVAWRDSQWQATEYEVPASLRLHRPVRKRWFRWEDDLRKYAQHIGRQSWQSMAQNTAAWNAHALDFVKFSF